MPISSRHDFVRELIERLGIPKYSRRFSINVAYDEAVTVDVEYFPTPGSTETVAKKFRLEEIPEPEVPEGPPNETIRMPP